jgi:hypothetical protein
MHITHNVAWFFQEIVLQYWLFLICFSPIHREHNRAYIAIKVNIDWESLGTTRLSDSSGVLSRGLLSLEDVLLLIVGSIQVKRTYLFPLLVNLTLRDVSLRRWSLAAVSE